MWAGEQSIMLPTAFYKTSKLHSFFSRHFPFCIPTMRRAARELARHPYRTSGYDQGLRFTMKKTIRLHLPKQRSRGVCDEKQVQDCYVKAVNPRLDVRVVSRMRPTFLSQQTLSSTPRTAVMKPVHHHVRYIFSLTPRNCYFSQALSARTDIQT